MKTSRILKRKQAKKNLKNDLPKNSNSQNIKKLEFKKKTKLKQIISFFRCRGWNISKNRISPE